MTLNRKKITNLTQLSLLMAILIIFAFTPLGFILVPPVAITLLHIPVIIGSILMGPLYGGILGLLFGILSMIKASIGSVSPIDMLFSPIASGFPIQSVILCILPRTILGILPALLLKALNKMFNKTSLNIGISAAVSTICHTILVLGFLWLFFKSIPFKQIFLTVLSINGTLEIVAAIILSIAICKPIKKYLDKNN